MRWKAFSVDGAHIVGRSKRGAGALCVAVQVVGTRLIDVTLLTDLSDWRACIGVDGTVKTNQAVVGVAASFTIVRAHLARRGAEGDAGATNGTSRSASRSGDITGKPIWNKFLACAEPFDTFPVVNAHIIVATRLAGGDVRDARVDLDGRLGRQSASAVIDAFGTAEDTRAPNRD